MSLDGRMSKPFPYRYRLDEKVLIKPDTNTFGVAWGIINDRIVVNNKAVYGVTIHNHLSIALKETQITKLYTPSIYSYSQLIDRINEGIST